MHASFPFQRLCYRHNADTEVKNSDGNTVLMSAAERGDSAAAALLLEHDANTDVKDNAGTPVMHRFGVPRVCLGPCLHT